MKSFITFTCLILFISLANASIGGYPYPTGLRGSSNYGNDQYVISWEEFKLKYRKWYPTPEIEEYRRKIFEANAQRVRSSNSNPGRRFARRITLFSDLTVR